MNDKKRILMEANEVIKYSIYTIQWLNQILHAFEVTFEQ